MPIYSFRCDSCGKTIDTFRHFSHSGDDEYCADCGEKSRRLFFPASFHFDFKPGWDAGLGQYVDTSRQRDEIVREKKLRRIKD